MTISPEISLEFISSQIDRVLKDAWHAKGKNMSANGKSAPQKTPWIMPIPEFGRRYYNLGRSAAYAAAARGDIPVKRVGGRLMGLPHVAELELTGQPALRPRKGGKW